MGRLVAGTFGAAHLAGRGLGHALGAAALRYHPAATIARWTVQRSTTLPCWRPLQISAGR